MAAAVDFYARAGLGVEAAKLLLREKSYSESGHGYVSAKMCFVFVELQIEKFGKTVFSHTATAEERLDGLMIEDEATSSGLQDEVWWRTGRWGTGVGKRL
jgi:WD repeat-containing protein 35